MRGQPFYVLERSVPRIDDNFLNCVVYLYPSVEAAEVGERFGGTGFLVHVTSTVSEDIGYTYCVTNSHIIREAASPVIRLNTKDGRTDILPLTQENWSHHQYGDDLAACPLSLNRPDYYD